MTMAQSNRMAGGVQFTVSNLLASENLEAFCPHFFSWHLFLHCSCPSSVLLFSYLSWNIFCCTRLCFHPLFIFSLVPAFLSFLPWSVSPRLPSFPWLRYPPLRVRPPQSTSNYYLTPDLFLFTPTTAFSICHPAPPSMRSPLCICIFFKKSEIDEPQ